MITLRLLVGEKTFNLSAETAAKMSFTRAIMLPNCDHRLFTEIPAEEFTQIVAEIFRSPAKECYIDKCPKTFARLLRYVRAGIPAVANCKKYAMHRNDFDWWGYPWTLSGGKITLFEPSSGKKTLVNREEIPRGLASLVSAEKVREDQMMFLVENPVLGTETEISIGTYTGRISVKALLRLASFRSSLVPGNTKLFSCVDFGVNNSITEAEINATFGAISVPETVYMIYKGIGCCKEAVAEMLKFVTRGFIIRVEPNISGAKVISLAENLGYPWTYSGKKGSALSVKENYFRYETPEKVGKILRFRFDEVPAETCVDQILFS